MRGQFLLRSHEDPTEGNIYADKSSLILEWLLREGLSRGDFSLREVSQEIDISLGLVQRVFGVLVQKGLLHAKGLRTAKKFFFKKSAQLLESWLKNYSITKKCKLRTYHSALSGKSEWLKALKKSGLNQEVILALHSAAEAHGYKNTNLDNLELYILDPTIRLKIEEALKLEPQERGYEVLLIEPYYKALLQKSSKKIQGVKISPLLLTFLDLYHFPLRGREQAEFIAERAPEMKVIYRGK